MTEMKPALPFELWRSHLEGDSETHFYTLDAVTQLHYWINDSITENRTFCESELNLLTITQFFLLTRHLVDLLGEDVTDHFLPDEYCHPESL